MNLSGISKFVGSPLGDKHADKEKGEKQMSLASISSMASKTMKLGAGMGAGLTSNLSKMPGNLANLGGSGEVEKKARKAAEKKEQLAKIMTILEDVTLQCPPSHTGLVVAYNDADLSPIMHPGLRFTWFRMSGDANVVQVDESHRGWYAPTVDDIGCVICSQCEDNFDQGLSRYSECGPIKADSLLLTLAESALENGSFSAAGICVSLGLGQQTQDITKTGPSITLTDGAYGSTPTPTPTKGDQFSELDSISMTLSTVLSKKVAFLQFDGRSTVEVDENGIFISIPTFDTEATLLAHPPSEKKISSLFGGKKDVKGGSVNKGDAKGAKQRSKFKTSRRGLRIPPSANLTISCAQPLSLVLRVPIKRASDTEDSFASPDKSNSSRSLSPGGPESEDEAEKMRRFLASSTVSIPWTYEGHNFSPEAYLDTEGAALTPEERREVLQEAERDSIIFASTIASIALFISELPEGTNELCICFSCGDRLVRDILVLSMRALVSCPPGYTRHERKKVFPWVSDETGETLADAMAESDKMAEDANTKKMLKSKEEENLVLKRERNELTVQLVEAREERMQMQLKLLEANRPGKVAKEKKGEVEEVGAPTSTADMAKGEYFKQLSGKIIEIENKLSIATKREADSVRARGETETRNTTLKVDLDKYQRSSAENASQLASLQSLYDMQARTVQGLESDQEVYAAKFEVQELKLREMEVLRATLERKEKQLGEVQGALSAANSDILNFQNLVEFKSKQVEDLQQQLQAQEQKHLSTVGNLEQELAATLISSKRFERELEEERVKTAQMERIQKELAEALGEIDKLNGQINHMQRKSESQTKDLQKVMKESASTLAEFEKALIRKSEECNELYLKLSILQEQVEDERKSTMRYKLMQAGRTNTSQIATSFISRLKRSSVAEIADKDRDSTGK